MTPELHDDVLDTWEQYKTGCITFDEFILWYQSKGLDVEDVKKIVEN